MAGKRATLGEIASVLSPLKNILVLSHYNPDADAYGSSLGLTWALRQQGKTVICLNETDIIERYKFVPGVLEIQKNAIQGAWDAVVVCDCGDASRIGAKIRETLPKGVCLINIDHHVSNDFFGELNYVDSTASSTCEIIFKLLGAMKCKLDAQISTCLLTGIMGDTGSFRYASTTSDTFLAAAELIKSGAELNKISQGLYSSDTVGAVRLKAKALLNLEFEADKRLALMVVDSSMYQLFDSKADETEGLVERARDIVGVEVAALMYQDQDLWRISLRSRTDKLDVSKVAAGFGGGGHKCAAAFRTRKSLTEIKPELIKELKKLFN